MAKNKKEGKEAKVNDFSLDDWIERDLTAAARSGELTPAFEMDDALHQLHDILRTAGRFHVLTGPPGVGKTAAVHELVRQIEAGTGPERLKGARVVQISLRGIAGRFPKKEEAAQAAQRLFDHILDKESDVVPYIRDIHTAF